MFKQTAANSGYQILPCEHTRKAHPPNVKFLSATKMLVREAPWEYVHFPIAMFIPIVGPIMFSVTGSLFGRLVANLRTSHLIRERRMVNIQILK
jgi:hypothetical protein